MHESSQTSQPAPPSRPRSPELLALRAAAGHATPEEVRALASTPRVVGGTMDERGRLSGGLVVYPPLSPEQWAEKYGGERCPTET